MRLRDFFTEEENKKFIELQMELLDARCKKERIMIQAEIELILENAKSRYKALFNEEE